MPRPFEVSVESPASVEQVHRAFADEDYWLDRFAAFGTSTTLNELTVDPDGKVTISTTQDLRHGGLPRLIAKFYPSDLTLMSTESWTPVDNGCVRGEMDVTTAGAPGSGSGSGMLAPHGDGSRLTFTGSVAFRIPLVGTRIESYLATQFANQIPEIQRFTTAWIAEHA